MNIVKATIMVVFTLLGLAILIPLFPVLVLMFGQSFVQGAEIGIGAVVLAFVFAVIKVSSDSASHRATLARLKSESQQRIRDAGFTNEADFRAAGGLRHEDWREIYAQSQGYKTWQEYTVFFIAQRKAGVSIDAILKSSPSWDDINAIYGERLRAKEARLKTQVAERKAAIIAKIADTEAQA
jgi:hypothetical protein